jgi:exodeoxyribonuclease VII large subunit
VVTGVGHETDFTIADLVADVRMPTPSAAAAAVVPDWRDCAADVEAMRLALRDRMLDVMSSARRGVADAQRALALLSPIGRVRSYRQQVDDTVSALQAEMLHGLGLRRARVDASIEQLAVLNPHAILQRGYAIVTNLWGEVVRDAAQVTPGELLDVHVHSGAFGVTVKGDERGRRDGPAL